jgi:hypothetical protein
MGALIAIGVSLMILIGRRDETVSAQSWRVGWQYCWS